ncbi:MAG: NAD-dependent epimerase/dehydratase family protein [Patescibacteria group bacterium]
MQRTFVGKNILITGGLGFIGSNLAIALVNAGSNVTILDNLTPGLGGNIFNIEPVKDTVTIIKSDIRDAREIAKAVKGKDYIFHLARQTDHILSLTDPFPDIDVNIRGTAVLLEACKKYNASVRLIYAGTRGQYGKQVKLPVSETAPTNPRGMYEITNLTAEKMVLVYHDVHGIASICLRLTNIYGPRSQMKHDHYGVVNWFVRLAMEGKTIPVYGDGKLKRDFIFIDDCIDAMLRCAATTACYGEVINVGQPTASDFLTLAKAIVRAAGSGQVKRTPFSKERAAQEPGDFTSDIRKITKLTGWKPQMSLLEGIRKTVVYYKKYKERYW